LTPNSDKYGATRATRRLKKRMMSEQSRRPSPKPRVPDMPVDTLREYTSSKQVTFKKQKLWENLEGEKMASLREKVEVH
jgi:hypothetical protein